MMAPNQKNACLSVSIHVGVPCSLLAEQLLAEKNAKKLLPSLTTAWTRTHVATRAAKSTWLISNEGENVCSDV